MSNIYSMVLHFFLNQEDLDAAQNEIERLKVSCCLRVSGIIAVILFGIYLQQAQLAAASAENQRFQAFCMF